MTSLSIGDPTIGSVVHENENYIVAIADSTGYGCYNKQTGVREAYTGPLWLAKQVADQLKLALEYVSPAQLKFDLSSVTTKQ